MPLLGQREIWDASTRERVMRPALLLFRLEIYLQWPSAAPNGRPYAPTCAPPSERRDEGTLPAAGVQT